MKIVPDKRNQAYDMHLVIKEIVDDDLPCQDE